MTIRAWFVGLFVSSVGAITANGQVVEFEDRESWENAVGSFTTIGFTEFPHNTRVTEQYAYLGVHFIDGVDFIACCDPITYPRDGAGLEGEPSTHLTFDAPMTYIAADFPGHIIIDLSFEGIPIYTSTRLGSSGHGFFGGLVSSMPFDEVMIRDRPGSGIFLDDLHFGPPIPAPSALSLLVPAGVLLSRRRRR
jgi:hypothetical protein